MSFVNIYGPTETTTVQSTFRACERGERRRAPIGRPIANTQVYILDGEDGGGAEWEWWESCISGEREWRGGI